jgi:DNA invertase Pin-like site-specific DNA recombinase
MATAYSYVRFSTSEQLKGDSFRRQTEAAERYAKTHGHTLDRKLNMRDLGISAYRGDNVRKGALGAFLKAVDDGQVQPGAYLLVENLDRVSRTNPWEAMPLFQQIINSGITIVTLQDERVWSKADIRANPMRIMESLIVMIRANEESRTKSLRLKSAWSEKRSIANTKPMTAKAPAWLKLDKAAGKFRLVEKRVAIVRRIFALAQKGMGQQSIVKTFNKEHVPCFGPGKYWYRSSIAAIQQNEAVIGIFTPYEFVYSEDGKRLRKAHDAVRGYFPAIISERKYRQLHAQRELTRALVAKSWKPIVVNSLLAYLARCPLCDGTMARITKGLKSRTPTYLVCVKAKCGAGCNYHPVPQCEVEIAIINGASYLADTALCGVESGSSLAVRIDQLRKTLASERFDAELANSQLRELLSGVVVNYLEGRLELDWRHGWRSYLTYALAEQGE